MAWFRWLLTVAFGLCLQLGASTAAEAKSRLVYLGTDPSCHFDSHPEGVTLAQNAIMWATGQADPAIAFVNLKCSVGQLLTAAGFTNRTVIAPGDLDTTDLSGFDVLWVGYNPDASDHTKLAAAAENVLNFVKNGGSLIVEPEFENGALDWAWAPFGTQIGNMDTNVESQTIVNSLHPVTQGLSDAGLSNWSASVHNVFTTPEAAGFLRLVNEVGSGHATVIVREFRDATTAPAMSHGVLIGLVLLLAAIGLHRRQANDCTPSAPSTPV